MRSSVKETSKKPEDNSKQLENTRKLGSNKQCFDCGEKVKKYKIFYELKFSFLISKLTCFF
jgi:hypothetical protein